MSTGTGSANRTRHFRSGLRSPCSPSRPAITNAVRIACPRIVYDMPAGFHWRLVRVMGERPRIDMAVGACPPAPVSVAHAGTDSTSPDLLQGGRRDRTLPNVVTTQSTDRRLAGQRARGVRRGGRPTHRARRGDPTERQLSWQHRPCHRRTGRRAGPAAPTDLEKLPRLDSNQ